MKNAAEISTVDRARSLETMSLPHTRGEGRFNTKHRFLEIDVGQTLS